MRLGSKTLSLTLLSATALQFGSAGSAAAQSTAAAEATPSAASQPAPAPAAAAATADPAAANSANASVPAIPKKTYTVPAGTKVLLQLRSSVNTKSARVGDGVYLSSAFPVVVGNHVMIPTGVFVQGVVDRVVRAGHMTGKSQLDMHFTSIIFPNGSVVEIPGVVSGLPGASKQDVKNGEGTIEQDKDKGRNAGKTAAIALPTGAGVGSVAGISSGHSLGGGLVGLGAGLATVGLVTLFTRGADVNIEAGTQVEMVLQRPLILEDENLAEGTVPGASPAMVPAAGQPKPLPKPGHPELLCPPGGLGCS
jgi:type IV secretion system protein VirB10